MVQGKDVRDHINRFNKCITHLLSVKVKIDENDQAIILLYQAILSSMSHTDQALVTMSELSLDWSTSKGRYDDRRDMLIHALGG
ncbi:hypothetical protein G4B88_008482, partial [Cannabis sativa]